MSTGAGTDAQAPRQVDVLIVGAGLSGIGTAAHLQRECPDRSVALLEARDALGGTWDLFRYPGVRSDSDMHTLGYGFRPWSRPETIARGPDILGYLHDTAREHGIDRLVHLQHRVQRAQWSSTEGLWTLQVERGPSREPVTWRCRFLVLCSGYYDARAGHAPRWPGQDDFTGRIVHPQHWPEGFSYAGRRVAVIGSGATAMTLVPAMAAEAAHVTMVQRSPTYVLDRPSRDPLVAGLRAALPASMAHGIARALNVGLGLGFYRWSRRWPAAARRFLLGRVRKALPGHDVDTHFAPRYDPWDQRLCVVPDGDLFQALRAGRAEVVTGTIERFTPTGLRLASGRELQADVIVTATGLQLQAAGGIALEVDGRAVDVADSVLYKSVMLAGVPNLLLVMGYVNASWTLKSDLAGRYLCRLLHHMQVHGQTVCTPHRPPPDLPLSASIDLSAGYVQRAAALLPRQASRGPWQVKQSFVHDWLVLRVRPVDDGTMDFSRGRP